MRDNTDEISPQILPEEVKELQNRLKDVDISQIRKTYVDVVHNLRIAGIKVSDRRAVKVQNLIAASAIICGRQTAEISDLWVLRHIWDTEEQIELLTGILDRYMEKDEGKSPHPQATVNQVPNAEDLAKEVEILKSKWNKDDQSFEEQNLIKDKLRFIQSRSNWIANVEHKKHLQDKIEELWKAMLQTL